MKHFYILTFTLLLSTAALGQSLMEAFEQEQRFRKTGMSVLGGWAVINIAGGLALRANTSGTTRYFHEMNALWNTVNLGIAAVGYISAMRMDAPADALSLYNEQMSLDKTLLFNAGLDLAYVAAGFWAMERSKNVDKRADQWKGYGQSLIMQGAFLFVFDIVMVLLHEHVPMDGSLKVSLAPGAPDFIGLRYTF